MRMEDILNKVREDQRSNFISLLGSISNGCITKEHAKLYTSMRKLPCGTHTRGINFARRELTNLSKIYVYLNRCISSRPNNIIYLD